MMAKTSTTKEEASCKQITLSTKQKLSQRK